MPCKTHDDPLSKQKAGTNTAQPVRQPCPLCLASWLLSARMVLPPRCRGRAAPSSRRLQGHKVEAEEAVALCGRRHRRRWPLAAATARARHLVLLPRRRRRGALLALARRRRRGGGGCLGDAGACGRPRGSRHVADMAALAALDCERASTRGGTVRVLTRAHAATTDAGYDQRKARRAAILCCPLRQRRPRLVLCREEEQPRERRRGVICERSLARAPQVDGAGHRGGGRRGGGRVGPCGLGRLPGRHLLVARRLREMAIKTSWRRYNRHGVSCGTPAITNRRRGAISKPTGASPSLLPLAPHSSRSPLSPKLRPPSPRARPKESVASPTATARTCPARAAAEIPALSGSW